MIFWIVHLKVLIFGRSEHLKFVKNPRKHLLWLPSDSHIFFHSKISTSLPVPIPLSTTRMDSLPVSFPFFLKGTHIAVFGRVSLEAWMPVEMKEEEPALTFKLKSLHRQPSQTLATLQQHCNSVATNNLIYKPEAYKKLERLFEHSCWLLNVFLVIVVSWDSFLLLFSILLVAQLFDITYFLEINFFLFCHFVEPVSPSSFFWSRHFWGRFGGYRCRLLWGSSHQQPPKIGQTVLCKAHKWIKRTNGNKETRKDDPRRMATKKQKMIHEEVVGSVRKSERVKEVQLAT